MAAVMSEPSLKLATSKVKMSQGQLVVLGVSLLIGLRIALGPYRLMADQPSELFRPVAILSWLNEMPGLGVIVSIQAAGTIASAIAIYALLHGRHWQPALAAAWVSLLFLAGIRGSLGKILHNDLLLIFVAVPFIVAPTRHRDKRLEPQPWVGEAAIAIMVIAYFFSGWWKLRSSGIEWVTGPNVSYLLAWAATSGKPLWNFPAAFMAGIPILCNLGAALILAGELTFPLILVFRRLRLAYGVIMIGLHVMIWLMLGLDYWSWAALVTLMLIMPQLRPKDTQT